MQERIGVIDLGSNTTRLVVMSYTPHHSFRLLDEVRETVRLAEGVGEDGQLQPAPMARGVEAMKMFHGYCKSTGVTKIVPVATSATREATNQAEFLTRVARESGLKLRVLSADEEAYYGYLGAVNALDLRDGFLVDIGGGSAQVTAIRGRGFVRSFSRPVGVVRFTERYVRSDPISSRDFKALQDAAAASFAEVGWLGDARGTTLAGIGGTIRTLAEIDQKLSGYPLDRVHGYSFGRARLDEIIGMLRGLSLRERAEVPGLSRDRADVIVAGAVILQQLMERGRFESILVCGQGLREGLFYEHFLVGESPPLFSDMRGFSVQNLARVYNYEAIHCAKVRDLSLSLFDQLRPLHGYGEWERELLGYAALVHDIGVAVGYYDHHKHGAYLVLNSALQGFSQREMVLLALLVRYHRKGEVSVDDYRKILHPSDGERVARLAAMLRLAEYLERSKSQVVQSLHVELGDTVRVITRTVGDAAVEIWDANRRAGLFQKAFAKPIEIV
ncbi:MAG TPA: Ppx/GppA phosphatase family protein [Kouleothrix sp.]|uniref:Ppx/GppA phosphatase family protein n=1 Tax=Kouleothrix sp. TaxID=2779161 RepID=UPI002CCE38EF|nr:Ppx/GppA phosphatase family protein [Kouleothrix sp.]HRC74744.1 Ppx/GppA phosphatase family protein [Kouleothrix sp.]